MSSIKNVRMNGLDLSPDYQRGYIWSNEYKDQLILSIILNYPIGNIVINNLDHPNARNARQELVDGKQRLTTILRFMEGGNVGQWIEGDDDWYKLSKKTSDQAKPIIEKIVGESDSAGIEKMNRVSRLSFKDLPASIQMNFNSYSIPVYTMQAADPAQIRDYFKVLQNQEKLRAGEIINALPDNPMSQYFDRIPAQRFMQRIGCKFKRAELEKVYYSVLGTWFGKLQLNSSDKNVISFVENMRSLTDEQIQSIETLDEGIAAIANLPVQISHPRSSKRMLKLLFGLVLEQPGFFSGPDVLSKVEHIGELSAKLAAFNSSESDEVAFAKYFGDEYKSNEESFKEDRAPLYRLIFSATTRSTPKNEFKRVMTMLQLLMEQSFKAAHDFYLETLTA
ncbi:DUF262 domain-containing protein [Bifidobacterium sp. ESL0775]|uniref:DUF262 domain-containing protein n=1 Tax=Bifidobacterium sp. ESL0775 TaxID=2983230 RepID=UPI0023F80D1F|nr:DUF262 domain-containing protein [Bifidobacterium sp. ESL0775]WEV69514.1 DUF262 domain-containing protein [Bifidobacterium sp. ESL0775]